MKAGYGCVFTEGQGYVDKGPAYKESLKAERGENVYSR